MKTRRAGIQISLHTLETKMSDSATDDLPKKPPRWIQTIRYTILIRIIAVVIGKIEARTGNAIDGPIIVKPVTCQAYVYVPYSFRGRVRSPVTT